MYELNDWNHLILEELHKYYSKKPVRLNTFFVNMLKVRINNVHDAHMIDKTMSELKNKDFIEWSAFPASDDIHVRPFILPLGLEDKSDTRYTSGTLEHHYVDARLTLDGLNYIKDHLRKKKEDEKFEFDLATAKRTFRSYPLTRILAWVGAITGVVTLFLKLAELFGWLPSKK